MTDDVRVPCRYALAFVGLSITEVVSSSLTVVGGKECPSGARLRALPDEPLIDTQESRLATHRYLKQVRCSHMLRCLYYLVMGMSSACRHHPELLPGEALQQNAPRQTAGLTQFHHAVFTWLIA